MRAGAVIAGSEYDWATISFDMRDATISGTATTQPMIDAAVSKVAAVHGVRSVTSKVVLAEYVSPFPFIATVERGVLTLSGGLPDEEARAVILAAAGEGARDETRLMSGAPNRANWLAAVDYALGYARQLDEGEVALADLNLTVSGRAGSPEAYAALFATDAVAAPAAVTLAYREVQPALASPFEWRAEYDGDKLTLSGATPSEALVGELEAMAPAGTSVSTSLVLGSGAPAEFATSAKLLLQNLLKLESGSATISDSTSTLVGSPADAVAAKSVRVAMTPSGAAVTLGPPLINEYWLSAERGANGIVLDGFVPDAALRDRLEGLDNVDASGLELGRGAPERFESAIDFVLEALRRMSEGQATIQGTVISVEGRAATVADFDAIETRLELGAPQGLILASTTVKPPLATPFTFAAEKNAAGQFSLSGYVPAAAVRKALVAGLPAVASDSTVVADGNPAGFEAAALKALAVLQLLDSGKVSYDGASWSLSGAVDTPQEAFAAESAFAATGLRSAGWTYTVSLPGAAETAALPIVDPYVWRAQKSANGPIAFTGFVPTEQLKRYLAGHAGASVVDGTTLGAGAPDGFIPASIAGLDALLALDEGTLALSAGSWSLTGKLPTTAGRYQLEAALRAATDTSAWHVAVQAADAAPIVTPFVWSAVKAADGSFALSGYVPTEEARRSAAVRAGKVGSDTTLVGSGEPQGFVGDQLAGLDALLKLESGEVKYDGKAWSISGQPLTAADAEAARAALATASGGGAAWAQALAEPTQSTPSPPPRRSRRPSLRRLRSRRCLPNLCRRSRRRPMPRRNLLTSSPRHRTLTRLPMSLQPRLWRTYRLQRRRLQRPRMRRSHRLQMRGAHRLRLRRPHRVRPLRQRRLRMRRSHRESRRLRRSSLSPRLLPQRRLFVTTGSMPGKSEAGRSVSRAPCRPNRCVVSSQSSSVASRTNPSLSIPLCRATSSPMPMSEAVRWPCWPMASSGSMATAGSSRAGPRPRQASRRRWPRWLRFQRSTSGRPVSPCCRRWSSAATR